MSTENKIYITAHEVSKMLDISIGHAYKIVKRLNDELVSNGYITIAGKVPKKYFETRWYGLRKDN